MTSTADADSRVEQLGYKQQLARRLRVWEVVGLAMADVSPVMAVIFLSAGVFLVGGTFGIGANLILAVVVLLIALCLAELATMYPLAGGMYSLVRRVLPAPFAWVTMFNYLIQGVVIPASISLGIVGFLKELFPGLTISSPILAVIVLAAAMAIALTKVEIGSWAVAVMVVVELTALGIITVAALLQPSQSLLEVTFRPTMLSEGQIVSVGLVAVFATLAPAFNVINGYDAALGFSEELKGGERAVARSVVISAILACVLILVPLTAAVIAAPDLREFFSAPTPILYSVEHALGANAGVIVAVGAVFALFNAMVSLLMYFGRVAYTTARDQVWPQRVNRSLSRLNRFRSPAAAVLTLTVLAAILVFNSALDFLIIFAGTVIAAVYFCVGLAAFWSRVSQRGQDRPYRMPLWPVPPVIVVAFTGTALVMQERRYLVAETVLIAVALGCWLASKYWGQEAAPAVSSEPDIVSQNG